MMKKIFSILLVGMMLVSNLTFVKAANMEPEKINVPSGTFTSHLDSKELQDFISKSDGDVTIDETGVTLSKKDGDHHALLADEKNYNSFIYEADIKLNEGISAGLVIGVVDPDDLTSYWLGANFNIEHQARLFKVAGDVKDYACMNKDETAGIDFTDTVHLYIEFNKTGNFVFKLANQGGAAVVREGKVDDWQGGHLGLLTFNSNATFSNIKLIDTSMDNNFVTNLEGIQENDSWHKSDIGITSNASGDTFLLSTTSGDNFVYEADVKFNGRKGAASLVFRSDGDLDNKNMYVANLNGKSGVARLFKFENNEAVDLGKAGQIALTENDEYHLKITVIDKHMVYYINGQLVLNTADYTMNSSNEDSHYGQNDAIDSGRFGLLTWDGNVTYQNVNYTKITAKNSPQLTNLSISSIGGKVDKQISFVNGQYVYISYVTNATTAIKLSPEIDNDSEIIATNENGDIVDLNNLAISKSLNTYTLTIRNGNAKVIYRIRVHKMQPDESYYNEDYRGQYHYSTKDGWANDPNGMVYFNGKYHLFYQYYDDVKWGPMHWAHATSTDLITWQEEPIEFYPDEYGTMYSGCAVIADHATAPEIFDAGEQGIVFLITANGTNGSDGQRVIGAYSKDGETFHKYNEGKVLLDWKDDSLTNSAFRDPKVFRYENKWFMVIAGGPLRIYSSDNLIDWQVESTYSDLNTECPDLYPLEVTDFNGVKTGEVKWVLNRGGRKYKIGDFKEIAGKWEFIPDKQYASSNANGMGNEDNDGIMNFGMDSYAAMTYYQGDFGTKNNFKAQDIIAINWMNTWDSGFCNAIPDANGNSVFNGTFNLQCQLGVSKDVNGKYYLSQTPLTQYQTLRDENAKVVLNDVEITEKNNLLGDFRNSSYEIIATINPSSTSEEVGFKVRTGELEETVIKYNLKTELLTIDRSKSGVIVVNDQRVNVNSQMVTRNADGTIDFHIYVDRSSVEVFAKGNTVAGAMQIFPSPVSQGLEVYSIKGTATGDITIYPLKTIWQDKLTPTKPLAVGLNKTIINGYAGDQFEINGWLSPSEISQELVYSMSNNDVVDLQQLGTKAKLTAKNSGQVVITASSKMDPTLKKECIVNIYKNNFKTNLSGFEAKSGNWYIDDASYIGSHNDNAFIFANKLNIDKFKYEVDVTYESGILNFILQSQSKNAFEGCYSLQLNGDQVRLFDFKNDYTFVTNNKLIKAVDNQYHLEINIDGNKIQVLINGIEYINTMIKELDRQYHSGYVGLGLYNSSAKYQNFYVTTDTPITKITTKLTDLNPAVNASLNDIVELLPDMVSVAGDDDLNKKDDVMIDWDLSAVDVKIPGTYKITGTVALNITTTVNVTIRTNTFLTNLVKKIYNQSDYSIFSYQGYLTALNQANNVLANPDSSQEEIDQAATDLLTAICNLVTIKELNEMIDKCEKVDQALYSGTSYQEMIDALNQAKIILNKDIVKQDEIDWALNELERAYQGLVMLKANENNEQSNNIAVKTGDLSNYNSYLMLGLISLGSILVIKKYRGLEQ